MVTINNLTFGYKRRKIVYENFSFRLEPGHVCGLLGKNGVGKSTLLYLICGLLHPQSGEVCFKGANSFERLPRQTGDLLLIPEEFDLPKMPLERFVRVNAPFYSHFSREQLEDNLSTFGLDLNQDLGALSMGQKKKVYISFALASGVSLLVMDEPTNGLDIPGKSQFRQLIARNMTEERSILISTHQVGDIDKMLDQVVILDEKGVILNELTATICEKLLFLENEEGMEKEVEILYEQPSVGGCSRVIVNRTGRESRLNLELFFNAVHRNASQIRPLFSALRANGEVKSLKNADDEE